MGSVLLVGIVLAPVVLLVFLLVPWHRAVLACDRVADRCTVERGGPPPLPLSAGEEFALSQVREPFTESAVRRESRVRSSGNPWVSYTRLVVQVETDAGRRTVPLVDWTPEGDGGRDFRAEETRLREFVAGRAGDRLTVRTDDRRVPVPYWWLWPAAAAVADGWLLLRVLRFLGVLPEPRSGPVSSRPRGRRRCRRPRP